MGGILVILLIVVVLIVSLALVIGLSLGLGWLLTLFLPFSLFEATLLGLLAAFVTGFIWRTLLLSIPHPFPLGEEAEENEEPDEIPPSRFWKTEEDRSWEKWFHYIFANSIYEDLFDSPAGLAEGTRELSIHLAEATVEILKAKSPRSRRLNINKGLLKHEMIRLGHPLASDDLLSTAVAAINLELLDLNEELREVMRERAWDEPAELF